MLANELIDLKTFDAVVRFLALPICTLALQCHVFVAFPTPPRAQIVTVTPIVIAIPTASVCFL